MINVSILRVQLFSSQFVPGNAFNDGSIDVVVDHFFPLHFIISFLLETVIMSGTDLAALVSWCVRTRTFDRSGSER